MIDCKTLIKFQTIDDELDSVIIKNTLKTINYLKYLKHMSPKERLRIIPDDLYDELVLTIDNLDF